MQQQGLGGIMMWSIDLDDTSGEFCNQGPFPLANTVKAVLEGKRLVDLHLVSSAATASGCFHTWTMIVFYFVYSCVK